MSVEHALQRIGRIIAADCDLQVDVRGVQAYACRGRIVVPSVENFAWLGPHAERMLHGLLDHEAGHALDTDFSVRVPRLLPDGSPNPECCEALEDLDNALEDGYVEARQALRYAGCAQNLAAKNDWFWRGDAENPSVQDAVAKLVERGNVWSAFMLATTFVVRPPGRPVGAFDGVVRQMLEECAGDFAEVRELFGRSGQSSRIREIAQRIYDRYAAGPACGWKKDETPLTAEDAIARAMRTSFDKDWDDQPYTVFSHEFDLVRDFSTEQLDPQATRAADHAMEEARETAGSLILAFEAGLRARRETRPIGGMDEGQIDEPSLAEYAVGSLPPDQMYVQRVADEGRDVAVGVLVDCSGSMESGRGSKSHLARRAAAAIHLALSSCQIPHEMTGFTTVHSERLMAYGFEHTGGHPWLRGREAAVGKNFNAMAEALAEAQSRGTDVRRFARECWGEPHQDPWDLLCVPVYAVFKSFAAPDARGLAYVDGIQNNLDGEAVLWQARRLSERPEKRRVMFVLSDGLPNGSHSEAQGQRYLREAIQRVTSAGIEVYGIGMQSDAVSRFYDRFWVAHTMQQLAAIALDSMVDVLTRGRMEQEWVSI